LDLGEKFFPGRNKLLLGFNRRLDKLSQALLEALKLVLLKLPQFLPEKFSHVIKGLLGLFHRFLALLNLGLQLTLALARGLGLG